MSFLLKTGEAARLVWIIWWVAVSAFVGTIADRQVADYQQRVAAREEQLAGLEGREREVLAKTLAAATAQDQAFRAAAAGVKARLDGLPDARATGWLVTLVHELAKKHGCTVTGVEVTARAAEPRESGLAWLTAVARLKGPYPALRAWMTAVAAAAPGRATGGLPIRQLSLERSDAGPDIQAECHFEVLAR